MNKKINNILTGLIAISSLISVALLWKYNFLLTAILIILAILMLLMNKSKQEIKTFVFCGVFGAMAETFTIIFGAWTYGNPNFIGIPVWLIILWGIAAVFTNRVSLFFEN